MELKDAVEITIFKSSEEEGNTGSNCEISEKSGHPVAYLCKGFVDEDGNEIPSGYILRSPDRT